MKILNLYAGIGGNRKLWGDEHDITAVEIDPKIANIYQDFFPNDTIVIEDAHEYLLKHFKEYDFIWSSPPCPTHSKARFANQIQNLPIYPDMTLYQEIILLKHYFKNGLYCIENVIGYYEPLITPYEIAKHYFWTNFHINPIKEGYRGMGKSENLENHYINKGFDISMYNNIDKMKTMRNCVEPETGLFILNCAINQGFVGKDKDNNILSQGSLF